MRTGMIVVALVFASLCLASKDTNERWVGTVYSAGMVLEDFLTPVDPAISSSDEIPLRSGDDTTSVVLFLYADGRARLSYLKEGEIEKKISKWTGLSNGKYTIKKKIITLKIKRNNGQELVKRFKMTVDRDYPKELQLISAYGDVFFAHRKLPLTKAQREKVRQIVAQVEGERFCQNFSNRYRNDRFFSYCSNADKHALVQHLARKYNESDLDKHVYPRIKADALYKELRARQELRGIRMYITAATEGLLAVIEDARR